MKSYLQFTWPLYATILTTLTSGGILILNRHQSFSSFNILITVILVLSFLFMAYMIIRGLITFADSDKMIDIQHRMDPEAQQRANERRRAAHYRKPRPDSQREIFFFGQYDQVTITAPDSRRALKFFNTLTPDQKRHGGVFKYSSKKNALTVKQ